MAVLPYTAYTYFQKLINKRFEFSQLIPYDFSHVLHSKLVVIIEQSTVGIPGSNSYRKVNRMSLQVPLYEAESEVVKNSLQEWYATHNMLVSKRKTQVPNCVCP